MKNTIEKLKELKENLPNLTNNDIYYQLINISSERDLDVYVNDYGFISSDEVDDMIANNINDYGVDRLRCFINDTYADDVYILDGYNNLKNVSDSDFEDCINNIIETLECEDGLRWKCVQVAEPKLKIKTKKIKCKSKEI